MYTATLKEKTIERAARRVKVVVTVTDGTSTFDETFSFSFNTTTDEMKKTVKRYLDELNGVEQTVTNLSDLTYTEPTEEAPTQAELDRQAWQADRAKLQTLMELVRDGVFTGSETQITNLQNKVKTDFKAEYLN